MMDRETEALNKVVTDNLAALDAENDAGIESRVAFLAARRGEERGLCGDVRFPH